MVSGRRLGVRVDRPQASPRAGVLRPRPERFHPPGAGRRVLVRVLVQRPDHRLRDAARPSTSYELTPSAAITQNEIDAAKSIHMDFLNVQDQPKFVWPATFALSRAYTDQLERWKGLSADKVSTVRDGPQRRRGNVRRVAARCAEQAGWRRQRLRRRLDRPAARAMAGGVAQRSGERAAVTSRG